MSDLALHVNKLWAGSSNENKCQHSRNWKQEFTVVERNLETRVGRIISCGF